jgi:hypothetical protein
VDEQGADDDPGQGVMRLLEGKWPRIPLQGVQEADEEFQGHCGHEDSDGESLENRAERLTAGRRGQFREQLGIDGPQLRQQQWD